MPEREPHSNALGRLLWVSATGDAWTAQKDSVAQYVPIQYPKALVALIDELVRAKSAPSNGALLEKMRAIQASLDDEPEEHDKTLPRQSTQELWKAQRGGPYDRAAGQPVFFIVGGLITAAVMSVLGTLGLF